MKNTKFKFSSIIFSIVIICLLHPQLQAEDSLKYITHAFVKIKTNDGMVIYIDPFQMNTFEDSADVVLITHEHGDHSDLSRVNRKLNCKIIRAADALQNGMYQSFTLGNVTVKAVPAYNKNHSKASCVGYVIAIPASKNDTLKIYHTGDTGKIPEMAKLAGQNITYALIPMDGIYTMTPEEATEAAGMIKAKYDIPIHTMPGKPGYGDEKVLQFKSPNKLIVKPGTVIDLSHPASVIKDGK